jgi:putative membrane protein
MVSAGHWRWSDPSPALPGVSGVPVADYAGWLAVAAVLMVGLDVAAGRATAGPSTRDGVMYALYLWTYLSSVLAHAVLFRLPATALYGGLGMGAVAVPLAVTLSRRAPAPPPAPLPAGTP